TGDTRPCDATLEAARGADLLVHDSSFTHEDVERAFETKHSTAREAARLASEAGAAMLALVHMSTRYHVGAVLEEAREELEAAIAPRDFDVVELPLPERGPPKLLPGAARPPRERR
ncbi:MAG: ribonuclease Z, partial [Solirubrobacterales bacterium]|nr:ribonuclease Z [Solirubrobacterales bacterium]